MMTVLTGRRRRVDAAVRGGWGLWQRWWLGHSLAAEARSAFPHTDSWSGLWTRHPGRPGGRPLGGELCPRAAATSASHRPRISSRGAGSRRRQWCEGEAEPSHVTLTDCVQPTIYPRLASEGFPKKTESKSGFTRDQYFSPLTGLDG